jgi:hypothetical protein
MKFLWFVTMISEFKKIAENVQKRNKFEYEYGER